MIATAILKPQHSYTSPPKKFLCNQDPSLPYKTRTQSSPSWTGTDSWLGLLRFASHWRKWKNQDVLWHPNSTLTSSCQFSLTTSKYTLIFFSEIFTDITLRNQKEILTNYIPFKYSTLLPSIPSRSFLLVISCMSGWFWNNSPLRKKYYDVRGQNALHTQFIENCLFLVDQFMKSRINSY